MATAEGTRSIQFIDPDDAEQLIGQLHTLVHVTTEASVKGGVVPENQLYDAGMKVMSLTEDNYGMIYHLVQQDEMVRLRAVISGEAKESAPSPTVSRKVNINGQWTDVTAPTSEGNCWYCNTNNKYGGSAYVYIWAEFNSAPNLGIKRYGGVQEGGEWNYGNRARLAYDEFDLNTALNLMEEDGVPASLRQQFSDTVVYKIAICAFDRGYHASYIVNTGSTASFAVAIGKVDDADPARAIIGLLSSE